ncbi:hypothetical protein GGR56DRAFT_305610 [Xylariaceae sp. FL0804]|nr:hypothetical protein GGR56DRAFT_305610 [Xylariaceae sp. FL0804]
MAALVQTYPQQSGTVTLLQTRPTSASGTMPGPSQGHPGQSYSGNTQRNNFHGLQGSVGGQTGYRGSSIAPVQPYAFTSTPSLTNNGGQWQQHAGYRTSSGTTVPTMQQMMDARTQYTSASTPRPPLNGTSNQPTFAQVAAAKASPERYRRPAPRQVETTPAVPQQSVLPATTPATSGTATAVHFHNPRVVTERKAEGSRNPAALFDRRHSAYGSLSGVATMDDMQLYRPSSEEEAKRFRRRSIHSINSADFAKSPTPQDFKRAAESLRLESSSGAKRQINNDKDAKSPTRVVPLPSPSGGGEKTAMHGRNASSESLVSSRSSNSRPSSSANRSSNASAPTGSPASTTSAPGEKHSSHDQLKVVAVPPRGSSSEGVKRTHNPSPLSKPVTMSSGPTSGDLAVPAKAAGSASVKPPASNIPKADSPAAKQLAAINEKGGKSKSKSSRLRRAFSFGSAAELRKAAGGQDVGVDDDTDKPAQPAQSAQSSGPARLHKERRPEDLYEEEQERIAQKQEESGIGSSIYSGTKLFSGSTDNLSISSTASSASIMLRKMGRGVKKGGRSLAGLFRPKSTIGVPGEELMAPEASQAAVSMVTVEAERDRVNVNVNDELQDAGGTGFPHLENNSVETLQPERLGSSGTDNSGARKSFVGGEKERAEVLATIRKGILKTRSNSPSPSTRGMEGKGPVFELPMIPNVSESPNSSAPSTPNDNVQGHKRSGSIAIGSEDYFMSALRLRQDTKSAPVTPQDRGQKRNATFSPRIVFYDTWPPGEYDRRGEIATCNRLTPMLAQQIKEELNSFKMEMEVHETSKIYTHFF